MKLVDHIADVINEDRDCGAYGSVCGKDIKKVNFRRGCAEVEVRFMDGDSVEEILIDAAPILTHITMALLHAGAL